MVATGPGARDRRPAHRRASPSAGGTPRVRRCSSCAPRSPAARTPRRRRGARTSGARARRVERRPRRTPSAAAPRQPADQLALVIGLTPRHRVPEPSGSLGPPRSMISASVCDAVACRDRARPSAPRFGPNRIRARSCGSPHLAPRARAEPRPRGTRLDDRGTTDVLAAGRSARRRGYFLSIRNAREDRPRRAAAGRRSRGPSDASRRTVPGREPVRHEPTAPRPAARRTPSRPRSLRRASDPRTRRVAPSACPSVWP